MPDVTCFNNRDGNRYCDNVLRDFLRYDTVECLYEGCAVHSLNICEGNLRYALILFPQQMNIDCYNRTFVRRM